MAKLILTGSVGTGGKQAGKPHNDPADVAKVRDRFVELGYVWMSGLTLGTEKEFIRTIKLFQSIVQGSPKANKGDGRIDLHGSTHRWLAAQNAPGWVNMFGKSGLGWKVTPDLKVFSGGKINSFTTTWMEERINWAGFEYSTRAHFSISAPPPFWIRDCSPAIGGDAPGHKSHETGLDVDMRLPLLPPRTNDWIQLDASNYTKLFHREAGFLQCEVIRSRMNPTHVFFNDPEFIGRKLTTHENNHSEHYHVRIKPPARIEGIYV